MESPAQTDTVTPTETATSTATSSPSSTPSTSSTSSTLSTTYLDLMMAIVSNPNTNSDQQKILINEIRKTTVSDRWTFRWAIWILGLAMLLTIAALWTLCYAGKTDIPQGLIAIGSGAAGGLAGLLTPGRNTEEKPK